MELVCLVKFLMIVGLRAVLIVFAVRRFFFFVCVIVRLLVSEPLPEAILLGGSQGFYHVPENLRTNRRGVLRM